MKTKHIQMTRGQTFTWTETSRDDKGLTRDLTDAKIYLAVRADMKIAPSFKLCSETPAPANHRIGIVIRDQLTYPGQYVVTIIPSDTSSLVALGHDDPWFYDIKILMSDGTVVQDISVSNLDLYAQVTDVP